MYGGIVITCDTDPECVEETKARCAHLPVYVFETPALDLPSLDTADFALIDSSVDSRVQELDRLKDGCIAAVHDSKEPDLAEKLETIGRRIVIPSAKSLTLVQICRST